MKIPNGVMYHVQEVGKGHKKITFPQDAEYEYYVRTVEKDGRVIYTPVKE